MIKPHFDGKRFSYPDNDTVASGRDVLRWAVTRKPARWPRDLNNPAPSPVLQSVGEGGLRLTFINHATVLIQCEGLNIITDPVFSHRVSPVSFAGPRRYRPAGLTTSSLPTIDVVLISHTHFDHLDIRSLKALSKRDNPLILAPLNNGGVINRVTQRPAVELSWWDTHQLENNTRVSLVPARHWTSRMLGDQNKCLWGGYVIQFASGSVYFAGDTGYGDGEHFRQATTQFGPFRCALLPIGADEPRWFMKPQHMNPAEAVLAFKDLQANYALGIHHGTFQLTDEAHDAPALALAQARLENGLDDQRFRALDNGQAWDVPTSLEYS